MEHGMNTTRLIAISGRGPFYIRRVNQPKEQIRVGMRASDATAGIVYAAGSRAARIEDLNAIISEWQSAGYIIGMDSWLSDKLNRM